MVLLLLWCWLLAVAPFWSPSLRTSTSCRSSHKLICITKYFIFWNCSVLHCVFGLGYQMSLFSIYKYDECFCVDLLSWDFGKGTSISSVYLKRIVGIFCGGSHAIHEHGQLYFFISILYVFISFSCHAALASTCSTKSNGRNEKGHSDLLLSLGGKHSFFHLSVGCLV